MLMNSPKWTVAVIGEASIVIILSVASVPLMMRKASEGSLTAILLAVYFPHAMKGIDCDESTGLPRWPKRSVFFMPIPDAMKGERSPSFRWRSTASDQRIWHKRHPGTASKGLLLIYLLDPQQALSAAEYQDDALPVVALASVFREAAVGNGGVQS